MGERVVTMVQLIMGEHVFAILNDQKYVCQLAHAGGGLVFGAKEQRVNSCWFCVFAAFV